MKTSALSLAFCLGLLATGAMAALKPGEGAPDFTVQAAQGGKDFTFSLVDALKKGPVVLYFYPKSFTSNPPSRRTSSPRIWKTSKPPESRIC